MSATDSTQRELERLRERKERINADISELETDPDGAVADRVSEIESDLERVDPRPPEQEGNRSMYEHLKLLKEGVLRDPDAYVSYRLKLLSDRLERVENEISTLESES